jgi:hypothetical protein
MEDKYETVATERRLEKAELIERGFAAGWKAFRDWLDDNHPEVAETLCEPALELFRIRKEQDLEA